MGDEANDILYVKAPPGKVCPKPGARRLDGEGREVNVVRDDVIAQVPNDTYYRRRIAKGDLIQVDPAEFNTDAAAPKKKPAKSEEA